MKIQLVTLYLFVSGMLSSSCDNINLVGAANNSGGNSGIVVPATPFRIETKGKVNWKAETAVQLYSCNTRPEETEMEITASIEWDTNNGVAAEFIIPASPGLLPLFVSGMVIIHAEYEKITAGIEPSILGPEFQETNIVQQKVIPVEDCTGPFFKAA